MSRWPASYGPTALRFSAYGDSQSAGVGSAAPPLNYPSVLAANVGATPWAIQATPGWQTSDLLAAFCATMNMEHRDKCVAVVWIGTNDLAHGVPYATAWANIQVICAALRAAGWFVVLLNVLPRTDAGIDAGYETARVALNARISASVPAVADATLDVASMFPDSTSAAYQDRVHLTGASAAVLATAVGAIVSAHI